jgi:hypothetical protein
MAIGTCTIDTARTFAALVAMGSGPRTKFGSAEQDTTDDGRLKWTVNVAATWLAEPGRRPVSDVIDITVIAPTDPASSLTVPCAVEIEGLRMGVSAPQARDGGRVSGGRPWWTADAIRVVNGHRPPKAE